MFAVVAECVQYSTTSRSVSANHLLAVGWLLRISCSSLPHKHYDERGISLVSYDHPFLKATFSFAITDNIHLMESNRLLSGKST